jgi:hypothetical protein
MSLPSNTVVEENLRYLLGELQTQLEVGTLFDPAQLSFDELIAQLGEYIDVGEHSVAYETLVSSAERYPFRFSSRAAIKLLEVGLLMGFKTERPQDAIFKCSCKR